MEDPTYLEELEPVSSASLARIDQQLRDFVSPFAEAALKLLPDKHILSVDKFISYFGCHPISAIRFYELINPAWQKLRYASLPAVVPKSEHASCPIASRLLEDPATTTLPLRIARQELQEFQTLFSVPHF